MKDLDGIRKKAKSDQVQPASSFEYPSANPSSRSILGQNEITADKKPRKFRSFLFFLYFAILLNSGFMFVHARDASSYRDLESLAKKMYVEKSTLETSLSQSDLEGSITELNQLEKNVFTLKLSLERWGQDGYILNNLVPQKSSLSKHELLVDSVYQLFILSNTLKSSLATIDRKNLLQSKGNYLVDLSSFRKNILSICTVIKKKISKTEKLIPTTLSETAFLLRKLDQADQGLAGFAKFAADDLPWLSGEDGKDKRILIIFQNNRELRGGSGGSLGSFGVADFSKGKLVKIDFGKNIYKLDQAFLEKEKIPEPPELIALNGGFWTLKNAGFAVDSSEALDKIQWFYQKETGEQVDGVITIDNNAFISLLEVIGPIEMKDYGKTISATNFVSEIESEVQQDYFQREGGKVENEPKKILGDMMPIFIERLANAMSDNAKSMKIVSALAQSLQRKDILLHVDATDLQARLDNLNFTGRVKVATGDYLYVNNSNLGGAKTDQSIDEKINLAVNISDSGETQSTLFLERHHTGSSVWPDGFDQNFIRVLVPFESKLIDFEPVAGNFQVWHDRGYQDGKIIYLGEESSKTVLNFWMSTNPQETSSAKITYASNNKISMENSFDYKILFQKQPGSTDDNVLLTIHYPIGFRPTNVKRYDEGKSEVTISFTLDQDKEITIHFEKLPQTFLQDS